MEKKIQNEEEFTKGKKSSKKTTTTKQTTKISTSKSTTTTGNKTPKPVDSGIVKEQPTKKIEAPLQELKKSSSPASIPSKLTIKDIEPSKSGGEKIIKTPEKQFIPSNEPKKTASPSSVPSKTPIKETSPSKSGGEKTVKTLEKQVIPPNEPKKTASSTSVPSKPLTKETGSSKTSGERTPKTPEKQVTPSTDQKKSANKVSVTLKTPNKDDSAPKSGTEKPLKSSDKQTKFSEIPKKNEKKELVLPSTDDDKTRIIRTRTEKSSKLSKGETAKDSLIKEKSVRKKSKKAMVIDNNKFLKIRKKIFDVLSFQTPKEKLSIGINVFLILMIILSVSSIVFNTIPAIIGSWHIFFFTIDILACITFGMEYLLRIWSECERNLEISSIRARFLYFKSKMGLFDLFAAIGFVFYLVFPTSIIIGLIQILRLVVLVKILRYTPSFYLIITVLRSRRSELTSTILAMFIGLFFASVMVYYAEFPVQPDKFPNLFTTMYWAGITMGTVGYGDIIPISPLGKGLTIIVILMGIVLFTLPSSLIGSGFMEEFQRINPKIDNCPNCSKEIKETEILTDIADFKPKRRRSSKKKATTSEIETLSPPTSESENFQEESSTTYQRIQSRTYEYLDGRNAQETGPRIVSRFILFLIILNAGAIMVETDPDFYPFFAPYLPYFAEFTLVVFLIEYILRVWTCVVDERYNHPIKGRLKYIITPLAIINLIAIIPYLIPEFPEDLKFLRMFRILLVFKVSHFSDALETVGNVLKAHRKELVMASYLGFLILIFVSTIMFYSEKDAQPDKFTSIPASIWWGLVTLATVGYGDLYPITTMGRFFATFTAFIGVGLFALPTGIIGAGFYEYLKSRKKPRICPHCGFVLKNAIKKDG